MALSKALPNQNSAVSGFTSQASRSRMIKRLAEKLPHSKGLEQTLKVMDKIPRHLFVESAWQQYAYQVDRLSSLPLGLKQTISQPASVAKMTAFIVDHSHMNTVLEIGTGSGYQCAVLAHLAKRVYTIERIPQLFNKAQTTLKSLKIDNVQYHHGDGFEGWPEQMLFDAIVVTAAPDKMPQKLLSLVRPNGCLIVPVGHKKQRLIGVIKQINGALTEIDLGDIAFVPMLKGVG